MDFYELEAFIALTKTLRFSKAADSVHLSPSALSRLITRLEEETGTTLIDRDTRQVSLTKSGMEFADFAQDCLEKKRELSYSFSKQQGKLQGTLQVYASVTACYTIVPDLLATISKRHPEIQFSVETGDPGGASQAVREGRAHIAVSAIPATQPGEHDEQITTVSRFSDLETVPVEKTPLVFVAQKGSQLSKLHGDAASIISSTPVILPKKGLSRERFNFWTKQKNVKPIIAAETAGNEAILALAQLGLGIGLVPQIVLESGPFATGLVPLKIKSELGDYTIGFIFPIKESGTEHNKQLQIAIAEIVKETYC